MQRVAVAVLATMSTTTLKTAQTLHPAVAESFPRGPSLIQVRYRTASPDFSAKWANFRGLVLFCIDAKFFKKIFVGKLLKRSTRFTCFLHRSDLNISESFRQTFPNRPDRRQILQENMRWKAPDEIYKIYTLLHLWNPLCIQNVSKISSNVFAFS